MRKISFGLVVLMFLFFSNAVLGQDLCSTPVKTATGLVKGLNSDDSDTCAWLGIPYAAPPVGDLRWKAPQPAQAWEGVRDASAWEYACMQKESSFITEPKKGNKGYSEDCLYLNIWRPKTQDSLRPLPVMVWIHGGGYTMGSGKYPSGKLSEFGQVVVVTINYRLNVFGFFASPALRSEDPNQSTGNYGSLDQVAALKWVHDNIANFGGDPDNVTIFGESAGGWSVCTMLATPLNRGMFSKAIMESGGCEASESLERGYEKGKEIAQKAGCKLDDLACLRKAPAEKLVTGGAGDVLKVGFPFLDHADGYLLTDSALAMMRAGKFNHVPLMAGSTKEEVNMILFLRPGLSKALPSQYQSRLERNLGLSEAEAKKAMETYPLEKYNNKPGQAFGYMLTDLALACPTFFGLESAAEQGMTAYYYRFDYRGMNYGKYLKAFHSSELPFVFNSFEQSPNTVFYNEKNLGPAKALSKTMQGYWTNFAKTGNPNGPGLLEWPKYSLDNQARQILDTTVKTEASDALQRCAVWDGYSKTHTPIFETLASKPKRK